MKTARFFICLLLLTTFATPLLAEVKNGFNVTVQKTTLTKDDISSADYFGDKIDRTLGLKVNVQNVSIKDSAEASIEYIILINRWGYTPPRYERYAGTATLAALKSQEKVDLVLGKSRVGGYKDYATNQYQDKLEAWKVTIKQGGVEVASFLSSSKFNRLNEKAVKATVSK